MGQRFRIFFSTKELKSRLRVDEGNQRKHILTLFNVQGGGGGSNGPPIGFSDLKFKSFKQSKRSFRFKSPSHITTFIGATSV